MGMPRSRGAASGLLLILLGVWGAAVPFIGPRFDFAYSLGQEWTHGPRVAAGAARCGRSRRWTAAARIAEPGDRNARRMVGGRGRCLVRRRSGIRRTAESRRRRHAGRRYGHQAGVARADLLLRTRCADRLPRRARVGPVVDSDRCATSSTDVGPSPPRTAPTSCDRTTGPIGRTGRHDDCRHRTRDRAAQHGVARSSRWSAQASTAPDTGSLSDGVDGSYPV